jgi:hypothetical protein
MGEKNVLKLLNGSDFVEESFRGILSCAFWEKIKFSLPHADMLHANMLHANSFYTICEF